MNLNYLDLTGKTFGRLRVIERVGSRPVMWRCICACGTQTNVISRSLVTGNTEGCGCVRLDRLREKMAKPNRKGRAYTTWLNMRSRCSNASRRGFKDYGGRGIIVCADWESSFDSFFADMGEPPAGLTLERLDVNGNYEPSNCIWASRKVQNNNKRYNLRYEIDGDTLTLAQICEARGLNYQTVHSRLFDYGWPFERAIGRSP